MIGKAIYSLLSNNAGVAALLGTKIYPERTPTTISQPFCIYSIYETPTNTKDGVSTLDHIDIFISHFAASFENGENINAAIRTVLDRFTGTVEGNNIDTIWFIDKDNQYDDDAELYQFDSQYKLRLKK